MIKIAVVCLMMCACAVLASPVPAGSFSTIDDVENEAEIVDALEPLPGNRNLLEKRLPVIRLTIPAGYLGQLYGTKNLAERTQLSSDEMLLALPGVRNLEEKAIPEAAIARMTAAAAQEDLYSARHPKSEVEKVYV